MAPMPVLLDYHPPTEPWIDVVHEDDRLIVVQQAERPADRAGQGSLARRLPRGAGAGALSRSPGDQGGAPARQGHLRPAAARLRQEGAGPISAASSSIARSSKYYVARVWGEVEGDSGLIDLPLATDWENKPRQRVDLERGRASQTEWEVIAREPGITRLKLTPLTGRTHQLRVHMLSLGHPILGDHLLCRGRGAGGRRPAATARRNARVRPSRR